MFKLKSGSAGIYRQPSLFGSRPEPARAVAELKGRMHYIRLSTVGAKFDQALHPRGEGGKFTHSGRAKARPFGSKSDYQQVQKPGRGQPIRSRVAEHLQQERYARADRNQATHEAVQEMKGAQYQRALRSLENNNFGRLYTRHDVADEFRARQTRADELRAGRATKQPQPERPPIKSRPFPGVKPPTATPPPWRTFTPKPAGSEPRQQLAEARARIETFSLANKPERKVIDFGNTGGHTRTFGAFDMKPGDLPGQRSMFDRLETASPVPARERMTIQERREAFHAKRQARIERLEARAASAAQERDQAYRAALERSRDLQGQPIIIGHHSERAVRAQYNKIDRDMSRSGQLHKESKNAAEAAEAARNNHAISSDDPDAGDKLTRRIADLERAHARMIELNKAYKKSGVSGLTAAGLDEGSAQSIHRRIETAYSWEKQPHPAWQLQNSSANIRRLKERAKTLAANEAKPGSERTVAGARIVDNPDANRVQIFHDSKPDQATRDALKRAGFRWAPSVGAWQAMRNNRTQSHLVNLFPELGKR